MITPSNVFLISLSLSDFCVGLFVQPLYISWRFQDYKTLSGNRGTLVSSVIAVSAVLCSFSLLTVTFLSIDRFLALRLHLRYNQVITVRRVSWFLVVLFLASILICSATVWFPSYDEFAGAIIALASFIVNAAMYWKIYRVVQRHKRQIWTQQQHEQASTPNAGLLNILRLRKFSLTMFYVYFILLLCYLPYISLAVVFPFLKRRYSLSFAFEISWTFVYINSSLNPLLYSWRLREIRKAMKNTLLKSFKITASIDV